MRISNILEVCMERWWDPDILSLGSKTKIKMNWQDGELIWRHHSGWKSIRRDKFLLSQKAVH